MAGFDDITKKAQAFLKDGKVQEALKSEKAEGVSDNILNAVASAADKATGGKHADKIQQAKEQADKKLGNQ
ncbi:MULTISPECIES: Rv0909 family putative TA system antitoxin [unclassified Frigoribacterium]|uniref:Rv0909 family putative TA system antitoxin n=1 Tax=unclassified Frigoribacterium TaxID=2627005 RepID=UPI001564047F|nr:MULTISPECIES: Rv0909 family putative TA system antitoxin [unclassified Frigoribacterium]NQW87903.1 antitoxin [Frigoribacterium sp. VKM Ac-2860]NQX09288.1 antitoxin [Frigoribacterium sp. VKM Ac-2859]